MKDAMGQDITEGCCVIWLRNGAYAGTAKVQEVVGFTPKMVRVVCRVEEARRERVYDENPKWNRTTSVQTAHPCNLLVVDSILALTQAP